MHVRVHRRRTRVRRNEQWQVVLYGDNNQIVMSGEKLHNKKHAVNMAHAVADTHPFWPVSVDG